MKMIVYIGLKINMIIDRWSDGDTSIERTFIMDEAHSVTAYASEDVILDTTTEQYDVKINKDANIAKILLNNVETTTVDNWIPKGSTITLEAQPKATEVENEYTLDVLNDKHRYKKQHTYRFDNWGDNVHTTTWTKQINRGYTLTPTVIDDITPVSHQYKLVLDKGTKINIGSVLNVKKNE